MSFQVTDAFITQYSGAVRFLAQQQNARFRPCCIEDVIRGEKGFMEQVAPTGARKVLARHSDSPLMNTQHARRQITTYDYDWGDLTDRIDRERMLIDPTAAYVTNAGFAMARAPDDEFLAAIFGTAYSGHSGTTALTWPNGNSESTPTQAAGTQVAVNDWSYANGSGNAGLTISKIISGRVAILAGEGDENEEIYLGVDAKHIGNLLSTTEFTSSDYQEVKTLNQQSFHGMRALGVTFVHTERLLKNSSGYYRLPMWRKSGMGIGLTRDAETKVAERPDKRFGIYCYADMAVGAARLEEVKIAELICV